jgi:hypothetical protein
MSAKEKETPQPTLKVRPNQTPFERFTDALSKVVAVPKSSLPKPKKRNSP